MRKKTHMQALTGIAALAAVGLAQAATTYTELESSTGNGTFDTAEAVGSARDGLKITGMLGNGGAGDVDIYSFYAQMNDTIDLSAFGTTVGLSVALYGPDKNEVVVDGMGMTVGIKNVNVQTTGTHYLAVTNDYCVFAVGGTTLYCDPSALRFGDYTLSVKATAPTPAPTPKPKMESISIEVKPGTHARTPANPHGNYKIPVAILSKPGFDALSVDKKSLRFGATGDEDSLHKCETVGQLVNNDNRPDLVCYFNNRQAGWNGTESNGTVKGEFTQEVNGKQTRIPFEGTGTLKNRPLQ